MERIEPIRPDRTVGRVDLTRLTPLERDQERRRREKERRRRATPAPRPRDDGRLDIRA